MVSTKVSAGLLGVFVAAVGYLAWGYYGEPEVAPETLYGSR